MTDRDDERPFRPRPGRSPRDKPVSFVRQVRRLAAQAPRATGAKRRFNGSGRGRGVMLVQSFGGGRPAPGARRVVVKARVVKRVIAKGQRAGGGSVAHLKYLQRDGTTREGARGQLYSAREDRADGRAFLARGEADPHQFRFIVAAEDGGELADLRTFTRDLMAQVEQDLGAPLDWVAVDHFNTAHPHSHVVLRGRDGTGQDLFIAGDYIAHGLRARASELMTLELGPETQSELRRKLEAEVDAERFTRIDRGLLKSADAGQLDLASAKTEFDHRLRLSRLRTLERLGLAEPVGRGVWRLEPSLEPTLRALGERGDILKAMNRALADQGTTRAAESLVLHGGAPEAPIVGRLIGRRLQDELGDRLALIVDGVDGRTHHVPAGDTAQAEAAPLGAIVEVRTASEARPADRMIADLAREADGLYRPSEHLARVVAEGRRSQSEAVGFVEAHVRRLEALRRAGIVERLDSDRWPVPADMEERAAAYEARRGRAASVRVLTTLDLEAQIGADGATWLDRQLVGRQPAGNVPFGFGLEVERALAARQAHHLARGDADPAPDGGVRYRTGLLAELERRELDRVGGDLAKARPVPFRRAQDGDTVQGTFVSTVTLASGRYALVENAREFTLVPWRPVIEPSLGQDVTGVMQGASISWRLGRSRGLGL